MLSAWIIYYLGKFSSSLVTRSITSAHWPNWLCLNNLTEGYQGEFSRSNNQQGKGTVLNKTQVGISPYVQTATDVFTMVKMAKSTTVIHQRIGEI